MEDEKQLTVDTNFQGARHCAIYARKLCYIKILITRNCRSIRPLKMEIKFLRLTLPKYFYVLVKCFQRDIRKSI